MKGWVSKRFIVCEYSVFYLFYLSIVFGGSVDCSCLFVLSGFDSDSLIVLFRVCEKSVFWVWRWLGLVLF
jgi:hypothetical protein